MNLTYYDEFDWERFPLIVSERISQLDPDARDLVALAEPGSTRIRVEGDYIRVTLGNLNPVDIGAFHKSALYKTITPGSLN